ncbi:MAG: DUF3460 family protein [Burkholderiaceae bacterium]|jgi:Protein of unknown function (DUF3460)
MSLFRRPHYQSDITGFIAELKRNQPDLEDRQRHGREMLWDKAVDRSAWNAYAQARVAQQPYVYQTESK